MVRPLRLRAVWLLIVPFFWWARPTGEALVIGGSLALLGLWLRGWAAGVIDKNRKLAVTGPYAFTRHPLYLGTLLLGLGVAMAGGHWVWPALFFCFYAVAYGTTMASERARMTELFGAHFEEYAAHVPALLPRLTPWRGTVGGGWAAAGEPTGFNWARYVKNREWEAAMGTGAGFAVLVAKWALGTG